MTLTVYQDGVALAADVFADGFVIEESADRGAIASWTVPIDDPAGSTVIAAHATITAEESTSIYGSRIATGYFTNRAIARSDTSLTSNARRWDAQVVDLNAVFGFQVITNSTFHHKRPAETDLVRVHWLLAQSSKLDLVRDKGLVATTGGVAMTKNDYAGQFPIDVLNDCAQASGRTFFAYTDIASSLTSLFYHKPSDLVNTANISVSNYPGDADQSTVFAPLSDAELRLDPAHFYSGVYEPYSGGAVYVTTSGRTLARDVVVPTANTTSRTAALARANRILTDYQSEEGQLTFTIRVPNTHVNAVRAGQRVQVKFSHLPGYTTYTYVRIIHRTVKPAPGSNNRAYDVTLECVDPIMVGPASSPGNSTTWPSNVVPFAGTGGGSFTFVKAAKTPNDTETQPSATFSSAPTSGNFLVAVMLALTNGSAVTVDDFVATFPSGWSLAIGPVGDLSNNRLQAIWIAYKTSDGSETTVSPTIKVGTADFQNGFLTLAEYTTTGTPAVDVTSTATLNGPSNTGNLTSITPTAGQAALIVQGLGHEPNYVASLSAGWNKRTEFTTGGERQAIALVDQIASSTSGSYSGTASVAGLGESNWFSPVAVFSASGDTPTTGQPVTTDSQITSSGSAVTTAYPFATKSLLVFVDGIYQPVTETDNTLGAFDLGFVPRAGVEKISVRYIAEVQ